MTRVLISSRLRKTPLRKKDLLTAIANRAIELTGLNDRLLPGDELSISLVSERTIARVNQNFLNHKGSTDVITFDYSDEPVPPAPAKRTFGEILVCPAVAAGVLSSKEGPKPGARPLGKTLGEEVVLYIVHGILHLTGLDDVSSRGATEMRQAEARAMNGLRKEFDFDCLFGP